MRERRKKEVIFYVVNITGMYNMYGKILFLKLLRIQNNLLSVQKILC